MITFENMSNWTGQGCGGVYALFNKSEVLQYVGQTNRIGMRVAWHRKNNVVPFDAVMFRRIDSADDRNRIEREIITKYAPPYNDRLKNKQARKCATITFQPDKDVNNAVELLRRHRGALSTFINEAIREKLKSKPSTL